MLLMNRVKALEFKSVNVAGKTFGNYGRFYFSKSDGSKQTSAFKQYFRLTKEDRPMSPFKKAY